MRPSDARSALRRSNPLVMLATGILVGAMLVAIAKQPAKQGTVTSGSGTGQSGDAAIGGGRPTTGQASAVLPGGSGGGPTGSATAPGAAPGSSPTGPSGGTPSASVTGPGPVTPGGSASPVGAAGRCGGSFSSGVQGVTNTTVKIGFALPDLGVLAVVVPVGDPQADIQAALAGMRKAGRLPICGRDIAPVFRKFNVLDPSQSRVACDGFADQDHVFAVVSLYAFTAAACVTQEKKLFLIDQGSAITSADFAATPLLYTNDPPIDFELRDLAYWAVKSGMLDGKKLGVYYNQNGPGGTAPPGALVKNDFVKVLAQLGHPVQDVVVSSTNGNASAPTAADPYDSVAIQRFKTDGIQVVFPLEFSSNFFQQAASQQYHPQWVVYSVAMASDAITSTYPSSLDGALGLLFEHVGEQASGLAPTAAAQTCFRSYTQAGLGKPPAPDSAAGQTLREACDPSDLLVRALTAAGRDLTTPALLAGMQTITGVPEAYYSNQTFGPTKHWGATQNVIERWHATCSCWKLDGPGAWSALFWQP